MNAVAPTGDGSRPGGAAGTRHPAQTRRLHDGRRVSRRPRSPIVNGVDDAGIVAAMREQDPAGLAAAYDAYADALFSYCASQLRDRDAAADAVHDAFLVAYQRADQLRDPSRLRPWLYAIARNECRRAFRHHRRTTALDEAAAVNDETVELTTGLREEELRRLVSAAADGLNPREREVIELAVRHDLEVADIAAALGQSSKHVHALLSKARQQLERAMSALIVARTGRQACETLDGLLAGWDGTLTVLLRKRVARHIDACATCTGRKRDEVNATALLATTPLLAAPVVLRDRVLDAAVVPTSASAEAAERAGPFDGDGFPVPLGNARAPATWLLPAGAAMLGAALLLGGLSFLVGGSGDAVPTTGAAVAPPTAPAAAHQTSTEPEASPPGQPDSPEPGDAPTSIATAAPPPAAEPAVSGPTAMADEPTPAPTTAAPPPLSIYCDSALTRPCHRLEIGAEPQPVYLVANVPGSLHVRARVDAPEWLTVLPPSADVAEGRPFTAVIEITQPCADAEALITFAVSEPVYTVDLAVAGTPCIRAR